MRCSLFLIPLLVSSAACDRAPTPPATAKASDAPATTSSASARATASSVAGVEVKEETESYTFAYRFPAAAARHAPLRRWLEADRDKSRTTLAKDAKVWMDEGHAGNAPLNPYHFGLDWQVVADLPRFLSLSGGLATYTGGAHGMSGMRAVVYDKEAGQVLAPADLFRSPAALETALGARACAALDAERERRRGEKVVRGGDDDYFSNCPKMTEATVLLGSSDRQKFDRVTVYFGPYVAGPYAEGEYELDLDADEALLKGLKPEYAGAFAARRR